MFTYDERAEYIATLDKSAYKVGTIDSKSFFGVDLNRWFTGEMIDFGGERHDGGYRTGKNIKYITLENGAVLDWPTLKYYIDVFNPADYLE